MSWLLFNTAAVNIRGNVPFQISGGFFPHALYLGMELLNYMEVLFLVFENFHIVFHGGCTNLYSYKSVCLFIDHSHVMVKGLA